MTARVPASDRTRKQMADVLSGDFDQSGLLRNAVRLIIEEALEAEVMDVLGRGYYERGEPAGYCNGNRLGRLKTAEGIVEFAVPQVTGTAEPWASEIQQAILGRTEELERLVVERYVRGLSMRDIEAAFTGADGCCALTKSAASQVAERLWDDDLAFAGRDLTRQPILYLFWTGQPREPVLAAWGIAASGAKVLLGLDSASKEDAAREFLRDLKARGMNEPVLVATDGAPGRIRAVEEVFPQSLRQRCLAHKLRNLGAKVPEERWREVEAHALAAYQALSPLAARAAATRGSSRARWPASRTTSKPASPTCACPSPTARPFGPQICWSGCSARNAAGPRPSPTPSANGPCSN